MEVLIGSDPVCKRREGLIALSRDQPLPLSGAGKVQKTDLRKPVWEGHDRHVN